MAVLAPRGVQALLAIRIAGFSLLPRGPPHGREMALEVPEGQVALHGLHPEEGRQLLHHFLTYKCISSIVIIIIIFSINVCVYIYIYVKPKEDMSRR